MAIPSISIYSAIGFNPQDNSGLSAAQFGAQLAQAETTGEKRVAVRINSGGGNWIEGQSMYDMLKASALRVDTYCVGLVASAATLPFMAGTKRYISAHAKLMIHECASGATGGVADLQNAIAQQQAINASMAQLYAVVSGQSVEKCQEMMAATTYLDADQAIALGFATHKIDEGQPAPAAELPTASLHSYYASLITSTEMKNLLLPILAAAGIATVTAASADADVALAVQAAFTERDQAKADLDEARAAVTAATEKCAAAEKQLADMEEEEAKTKAEAATAAVTALVDGAISAGRITASQRETYTVLATANLTSTKAALDGLPARKSLQDIAAEASAGTGRLTAAGMMAEISARARA